MTKANLGLGVLALPSIFGAVGLVPGIILIIVIQTIIACELNYTALSSTSFVLTMS